MANGNALLWEVISGNGKVIYHNGCFRAKN